MSRVVAYSRDLDEAPHGVYSINESVAERTSQLEQLSERAFASGWRLAESWFWLERSATIRDKYGTGTAQ